MTDSEFNKMEKRLRYIATHSDGRIDRILLHNVMDEFKEISDEWYVKGWNDCLANMPKKLKPTYSDEAE